MPLYEFVCSACGAAFEEICQASSDAPICPHCGANAAERQISAPNPLLKNPFPFKPTGEVRKLGQGRPPGCAGSCANLPGN